MFYESRLQDNHLVIPSVLQGLRALVSSHPQPTVLGCIPQQCQGGATPGYGLEHCVEQGLAGLSAHMAALPCLLSSALPLVEELETGNCFDFLPCVEYWGKDSLATMESSTDDGHIILFCLGRGW